MVADERRLVAGESVRLLQDHVRDGELADVVELGDEAEVAELLRAEADADADVERELRDARDVLLDARLALEQRLQERLVGLLPERVLAELLVVEAPVGEAEHVGLAARLGRQRRAPERAADREAAARLAQRGDGALDDRVGGGGGHLAEDAELVAAEAVGSRVAALELAPELAGEVREQPVARGMAEGVVVLLEAVEVEHREQPGALGGGDGERAVEVEQQPPAVVEPGQHVGLGLDALELEQPRVLGEERDEADDREHERRHGEDGGRGVEVADAARPDEGHGDGPATAGTTGRSRAVASSDSGSASRSGCHAANAIASIATGQRRSRSVP